MAAWVRVFVAALAAGVVASTARPVLANETVTEDVAQWGFGLRYGFELEEGDANPWGPGVGFEAGYTLPSAIYLGFTFDWFLGGDLKTQAGERTYLLWHAMAEGGYDLGVGRRFVVRPKLGVGFSPVRDEPPCSWDICYASDSGTYFVMAPGVKLLLVLSEKVSVSVDVRYDLVFASEETLNGLILGAGVGF